jgi:hypothetical protein
MAARDTVIIRNQANYYNGNPDQHAHLRAANQPLAERSAGNVIPPQGTGQLFPDPEKWSHDFRPFSQPGDYERRMHPFAKKVA